jgi:hypothetical protein
VPRVWPTLLKAKSILLTGFNQTSLLSWQPSCCVFRTFRVRFSDLRLTMLIGFYSFSYSIQAYIGPWQLSCMFLSTYRW